MFEEEPERIKQGYQPLPSKNAGVIPPNAGSHVRMKENEYTWKDLDKAWWEGFDNAKNKMEKRIADLEKENAELKTKKIPQLERRIASIRGAHSVDCRKLNAKTEQVERLKKENAELRSQTSKAKKIIGNLYAICKDNHYPNSSVLMEQAEYFLNSEVSE